MPEGNRKITDHTDHDSIRVSSCCSATLQVGSADEGTNYYTCSACGKPCDEKLSDRKQL